MTVFEAKEKLTALQRKMAAYEHAQSLLYYDGCTSAPKGSAGTRANSLSILSEESYKLYTGEETVQLLEFLDAHKDELNEKEQRIVYLLLKDIREMAKIPMDEYVAYQELLVRRTTSGTRRRRPVISRCSSPICSRSSTRTANSRATSHRKRIPTTTTSTNTKRACPEKCATVSSTR